MTAEKKQFIAGAICPKCGDEDSLVLFSLSKNVACVSCEFEQSSDQRDALAQTQKGESPQTENKPSSIKITQLD